MSNLKPRLGVVFFINNNTLFYSGDGHQLWPDAVMFDVITMSINDCFATLRLIPH